MRADAVFEGGGVKAIGFVGAVAELERNGYTWERVAGTSGGGWWPPCWPPDTGRTRCGIF
ncbi:patatin-like phospholipase family protein [Calditerricola satsumensis]|uniref:patatin-like phospholipase family protein n=1 Tax=Calditerricola satsumensis TaxID=373054 RepID=UPI00210A78F4|nr:patatin-like phospholipase family protein [Calditerricola satsumensis]